MVLCLEAKAARQLNIQRIYPQQESESMTLGKQLKTGAATRPLGLRKWQLVGASIARPRTKTGCRGRCPRRPVANTTTTRPTYTTYNPATTTPTGADLSMLISSFPLDRVFLVIICLHTVLIIQ